MRQNLTALQSLLVAGGWFALDLIFLHIAIAEVSVAKASLLNNLAPVFSGFFVLVGGGALGGRYWFGLMLSIIGVCMLAGLTPSTVSQIGTLIGEGSGILSALFFALYLRALEKARNTWSTRTVMFGSGVASVFVLLPYTLFFETALIPPSLFDWGILFALACLCQLLGQASVVYSAAHLSNVIIANGMMGQTLFAAFFGFLIFGEALNEWQIFGFLLVLAGLFCVVRTLSVQKP